MNPSNKRNSRTDSFIIQGSILAIAGIVVRIIGMLYRVPLNDVIGTEGNGYYTSAYSIYALLLILSSYSLPVAISKIISDKLSRGEHENVNRVMRVAFVYATIAGAIMFSVLWFGSGTIAGMLHKPFCKFALKSLAPTIWIMAYLGVLRGYFQGRGTMVPTAMSQILEQIVNAVISIVAAKILFERGLKANLVYDQTEYSYAFGAAGGTLGTGAGAFAAFIFCLFLFVAAVSVMRNRKKTSEAADSYKEITILLAATILPILFSSTVYNISNVVDDFIFSSAMTKLGKENEIVKLWGYQGQYQIIFNIPVAFATALSSSLIPSLTQAVAKHDRAMKIEKVRSAIGIVMMIAIPSFVGLTVLAEPICNFLFNRQDNAVLVKILTLGASAVVFFSLSTISNAILQGLGRMGVPLKNACISLVIHVISLAILLYVAKLGVYSVVLANIIFALSMCILNQVKIHQYLKYRQGVYKTYIGPAIASVIMGCAALALYRTMQQFLPKAMMHSRAGLLVVLIVVVGIAAIVYFVMLVLTRTLTRKDLKNIPGGKKLKRFVPR